MTIVEARGRAFLSRYGKRQVAVSMYVKGKAFIGAAILLRQQGNSEQTDHVVLDLLCRGIEVTLKGLLLLRNYDRFIVRLRKPLGHNLVKVAEEASTAYGFKPLRSDLDDELRTLSNLYSQHLLRYGTDTTSSSTHARSRESESSAVSRP
jgi:hypothetical protein